MNDVSDGGKSKNVEVGTDVPIYLTRPPAKKILGMHVSAFFEALIGYLVLLLIDHFFGNGDHFFDVKPHPFWIIILIISAHYGTIDGVVSVLMAIFFLYIGNTPQQNIQETMFEYQSGLVWRPVLWFISALVLGEMRMRQENEKNDLQFYYERAQGQADRITEAYEALKEIKENLEVRIASQSKTVALIYKTFKALGTLNLAQLLLHIDQVIKPTLNAKKFSVYSYGPQGFEASIYYGWSDHENYALRFTSTDLLYQKIAIEKQMVCIINPEDAAILAGEGILAAPLIDNETDEIFGMLKIEEIDFLEFNISNLETFKTICELIGIAYSNVRKYKKIEQNTIFDLETNFFSYPNYLSKRQYLIALARHHHFPLSLLTFVYKAKENRGDETNLFDSIIKNKIPKAAQIFKGRYRNEVLVLFPFYTTEQVRLTLKNEAAINGNEAILDKEGTYHIESLYHPIGQSHERGI